MTEIVWGVFTARGDGATPTLCKLMDERLFFDEESAVYYASEKGGEFNCKMDVRQIVCRVEGVVR